ncbi:MAG TPA: heparan-alpha-glucosaminide N-acetyltransferase domain-containing protein [Puia sp.]|nr:heparan-alpha-glucosaminide N-acetyltransferase domain-containing protein [Puia sp.]
MKRIASIDIARGLVMVIMALDHTRDFLDTWSRTNSPTNLAVTTPLIFFTRWITHLCAPAFVFLAGTSIAIQLARSTNPRSTRRWLLRRGLILIAVEFTIMNFGFSFDPRFRVLIFEVIGTIGAGMILLSLLSRLSIRWLLPITALIFFGHDMLPFPPPMAMAVPNSSPVLPILRALAWSPGNFQVTPHLLLLVAYPILPWLGIMLTGFVAARWFDRPTTIRKRLFLRTGLIALGLFILLRLINSYGDPDPWSAQKDHLFTILSFLNVTKYPPSLDFSLLTLGALFLVLALAEPGTSQNLAAEPPAGQIPTTGRPNPHTPANPVSRTLLVFGRVPLFYFIIHFYLIHLLVVAVAAAQGFNLTSISFGVFQFGPPVTAGSLPTWCIYPIWLAVVAVMYPLSVWYGHYKATHPAKTWLRYF